MSAPSAVRVAEAFDNPEAVLAAIREAGPFWPLSNYASNDAEMATLSASARERTFSPPWFRQDFVRAGEPLVGVGADILANPRFLAAAEQVGGPGTVAVPTSVYVNVMGPTPFAFPPHLDVPAFRGMTRAHYPIWLLKVMMTSGLFEAWRIRIATAVSWFYEGEGGDFHYWPDGANGDEVVISPPFRNVSVVADNERTFHGVAPLGAPDATLPEGLGSDCRLVRGSGHWEIIDGDGAVISTLDDVDARVTISWKADLFADEADYRRTLDGVDNLTLDRVVELFSADLTARGVPHTVPTDPLGDEAWTDALARTYPEVGPNL